MKSLFYKRVIYLDTVEDELDNIVILKGRNQLVLYAARGQCYKTFLSVIYEFSQ
jgi:hypothetical protein